MSDVFVESVIQDPVIQEPVVQEPVVQDQVVQDSVVQDSVVQDLVLQDQVVQDQYLGVQVLDPSKNPIIEIIESPPNPIVELMKQTTKIALLIGLNYVDSPDVALQNRIKSLENAKHILINDRGFTEQNIIVLIEPCKEILLTTINTIIGSSSLISEIFIYYSGYGNGIIKTESGFYGESGSFDNLSKVMVPSDFVKINQEELTKILSNSCCKTVCIMDMCPYNDNMLLKWCADINNNVKVVTLCESDSHNTNKNAFIQLLLREYAQ